MLNFFSPAVFNSCFESFLIISAVLTCFVFVTGIFVLLLLIVFLLQILNSSDFILVERVGSNA